MRLTDDTKETKVATKHFNKNKTVHIRKTEYSKVKNPILSLFFGNNKACIYSKIIFILIL